MNKGRAGFAPLVVGLYAWLVAVFFGGILLDIVYSNSLSRTLDASATATVFSGVSDLFLRIGFVVFLSAIGAIASSWRSAAARNLLIASLLVLSLEILIPVFLFPFLRNAPDSGIGPWLRIIPSGLGSILAFAGLRNYDRQRTA